MRVEITRADIALGLPRHHRMCPVARAIERACGHMAIVNCSFIGAIDESGAVLKQWDTPPEIARWIVLFDNLRPSLRSSLHPFEFEL